MDTRWMRLTHITAPEQLREESLTDVGSSGRRSLSKLNEGNPLDSTHMVQPLSS